MQLSCNHANQVTGMVACGLREMHSERGALPGKRGHIASVSAPTRAAVHQS